jgi:hypothetical protein
MQSTEEIELEIVVLPPHVLTKLYNFVLRPLRQPTQKRNRTGKGTGTSGLSGRAWMRLPKPRRSINWTSGCGFSRIPTELRHPTQHLCKLISMTAIIHRTLLQTTARAASRSNSSSVPRSCDARVLYISDCCMPCVRSVMLVDVFLHPRLIVLF